MSKRSLVLLVVWNVLLSGAFIWMAVRPKAAVEAGTSSVPLGDTSVKAVVVPRDTAGLRTGRIAFFFMDSVSAQFDMIEESHRLMASMEQSVNEVQGRIENVVRQLQELNAKDHTYSTMAEKEHDLEVFKSLQEALGPLQEQLDRKQKQLDAAQMKALREIVTELRDFLEEYNRTATYDYIISVQNDGQIWVGNKGLDITSDIVNGLNARHRAKKAVAPPAMK